MGQLFNKTPKKYSEDGSVSRGDGTYRVVCGRIVDNELVLTRERFDRIVHDMHTRNEGFISTTDMLLLIEAAKDSLDASECNKGKEEP